MRLNIQGQIYLRTLGITTRQLDFINAMLKFDNQQEVADACFVTLKAVKFQLNTIYRRMGVSKAHGMLLKLIPFCEEYNKGLINVDAKED